MRQSPTVDQTPKSLENVTGKAPASGAIAGIVLSRRLCVRLAQEPELDRLQISYVENLLRHDAGASRVDDRSDAQLSVPHG